MTLMRSILKITCSVFLIYLFFLTKVSIAEATFPGSNGKIAFPGGAANPSIGSSEIWTMSSDGNNVERLTFTTGVNESAPQFSSDGTQMVFGGNDIFRMDQCCSTNSPIVNLTNDGQSSYERAGFSPDGSQIVFASNRNGNWDLFTMNSDGTNLSPLVVSPQNEFEPAWSPDGKYVVFDRGHIDFDGNLYIINVVTKVITSFPVGDSFTVNPSWSPDSQKIAFATRLNNPDLHVYTINVDGTGLTRIIDGSSHGPIWSPDGTKLGYVTGPGGPAAFVIYDLVTGQSIGEFNVSIDTPDWQPVAPFPPTDTQGPITSNVVATPNPVAVGTSVTLTASVNDSTTGNSNISSAEYSINDSSFVAMIASNGQFDSSSEYVTATLSPFASSGVNKVCVRGTDSINNVGSTECIYLVIYDPTGNFVTGAGSFASPTGALVSNPTATGKFKFGFNSRYQPGGSIPIGQTSLNFKIANFEFDSSSYDWLVVNNLTSIYQGSGTVNGTGDYGFILSSIDGDLTGGDGIDRIRVKIWDKITNQVIYDNQPGDPDTTSPTAPIDSGRIKTH